jgi:hypothetical protein
MTGERLLKEYPTASAWLHDWSKKTLLDSCNADDTIPEEFKEFLKDVGVKTKDIELLIDNNARSLFDFFDDNGIYIQITGSNEEGWKWAFDGVENDKCVTRKAAEKFGVAKAFYLLELILAGNFLDAQE